MEYHKVVYIWKIS